MNHLYLKLVDSKTNSISVESLIPLFVYEYLNSPSDVSIHFIEKLSDKIGLEINEYKNVPNIGEDTWITTCELPNLYKADQRVGFSGICCLVR